jgi:hypothetical protein
LIEILANSDSKYGELLDMNFASNSGVLIDWGRWQLAQHKNKPALNAIEDRLSVRLFKIAERLHGREAGSFGRLLIRLERGRAARLRPRQPRSVVDPAT